jgi:hypothetical protein
MSNKKRSVRKNSKSDGSEAIQTVIEHKKDTSPYVFQKEKIDFDLNIKEIPWTEKQKEIINTVLEKKSNMTLIDGIWGSGKAQPLDSEVVTPDGIKRMGDLNIGDYVCTPDGKTAPIIGIFPQGEKNIVKITFSDGSIAECCEDHLWKTHSTIQRNYRKKIENSRETYHAPKDPSILTAKEIKETLYANKRGDLNHMIPMTNPVFFPKKDLPLNPYVMGALLGDGSFRWGTVTISSTDSEIIENINKNLPKDCFCKQNKNDEISYNILDEKATWCRKNRVTSIIENLNLFKKYSYEKHIPEEYKLSSVEQRIELLRGLMDTDGTTEGTHTTFCTSSKQLALDVKFLVESLGGSSKISTKIPSYTYKNVKLEGRLAYIVVVKMPKEINPFFLKRKAERWIPPTKYPPRRYISSVENIGVKNCQCIMIDSEDHLYLTNEFIVTHNTIMAVYACLKLLNAKKISNILYVRNIVQSGTGTLGWLGGDLQTRLSPYMVPLNQKLEQLLPANQVKKLIQEQIVEAQPVALLRGTSYDAYGIIIDEMGCMSKEDIMLTLSRVGKFSYVFGVGDSWQVDIKNSGFKNIFDVFNDEESREHKIYTFELQDEMDVMRSEFLKFVMKKVRALK